MNCLICNSETKYYFSKTYTKYPYNEFMKDIGTIDYHRCNNCGFVISKTHVELDSTRWTTLNNQFHHYIESSENLEGISYPPYIEQALMLLILDRHKLINMDSCLDYAAGYGTLSRILGKYFHINLPIFDPYVQDCDTSRYVSEIELGMYQTVINSAMFEHVRNRENLDAINRLVAKDGCLVLHTVVCENIPKDPNWFYLIPPVHTAFHTNRSMEILMQQWGYLCSIYSPKSKCWILFKRKDVQLPEKLRALNKDFQSEWFLFKDGFVDYWKGF